MPAKRMPLAVSNTKVYNRLHLSVSNIGDGHEALDPNIAYFRLNDTIVYEGFADDFGPMNLAAIFNFCNLVDEQLALNPDKLVTLKCQEDPKAVTNAVFLLGSYLIMRHGLDVGQTVGCCGPVLGMTVAYRDVSPGPQNFFLQVKDCWAGLHRARSLQWIDFADDNFDVEEYLNYDSPLNADLHEIVPGKLIAMRGPRDIPSGAAWEDVAGEDGRFGHRDFSPAHYVDILRQFDVRLVVRLNAPCYDARAMEAAGIAVAELCFEDCTAPPVDVAAKFLALAEAVPGAIAVHCKAGLGRTGTLIALYAMRRHGFTARAAMGWLRVVRPGSVIGPQQDFLCAREALMRRSAAPLAPPLPPSAGLAEVRALVEAVGERFAAQYRAAVRALAPPPPPLQRTLSAGQLAAHVTDAAGRRDRARAARAGGAYAEV